MQITREFLKMELEKIDLSIPEDKKTYRLAEQMEKQLTKLGLKSRSNLVEVMEKGNHLTLDEKSEQVSVLKLLERGYLKGLATAANQEEFAIAEIAKIDDRFESVITKSIKGKKIIKDVVTWDRSAVAFYCLQNNMNLTLDDLSHFILVFEPGDEYWVDSFRVGNALHEFSWGVAASIFKTNIERGIIINKTAKEDIILSLKLKQPFIDGESIPYYYKPEYEFETSAQKLAWLYELGVLSTVLEKAKFGTTYNFNKAAQIIESFTNISSETIRKTLEAIFDKATGQSHAGNGENKNDPLNTKKNKSFILEMKKNFGLD